MDPCATEGFTGVTAIDESEGFTVREAVPLTPLRVAAMVDEPAATAVARPAALTVAAAGLELFHVAVAVTSTFEPSL